MSQTPRHSHTPDPSDLLARAVRHPFADDRPSPAVFEWYALAREKAPLWCFDTEAFLSLQDTGLPSSRPLSRIVGGILRQERHLFGEDLSHLALHVAGRRLRFQEETILKELVTAPLEADGAMPPTVDLLEFRYIGLVGPQELVLEDPDGGEPERYEWSRYWEIGAELVELVDAVEVSLTKRQRRSRQEDLDEFLAKLGATRGPGRPEKGPPMAMLEALFEQGKWLFGVCWEGLDGAEPGETAQGILEAQGIPPQLQRGWAVLLALPMLSALEVGALLREVAKPLGRKAKHTPPRHFTIHALEQRLRVKATTLAAKLDPPSQVKYFRRHRNPIGAKPSPADDA